MLPNALLAKAKAGTLAGAYLLSSPDPAGLLESGTMLAASLLCKGESPPCTACVACRKVREGIHPDLILVASEGEITVAQIRALRRDVYIRPNESARKVYWIQNAHSMNPNAQNALLKVLEEGPPYAAFLLTTTQPAALLPTVLSRCQSVVLAGVAPAVDEGVQEKAAALVAALLGGDELSLCQLVFRLEKEKRDDLAALLYEGAQQLLTQAAVGDTHRLVPLATALRQVADSARANVGVGLMIGWLLGLTNQSR